MNEETALHKKAREIEEQLADDQQEIALDKPKPPEPNKPENDEKQDNEQAEEKPKESGGLGGYSLGDALKAPLEPPKPDVSETAHDTRNSKVKILMAIGLIVIIFGFIISLTGLLPLGIVLVVIGAIIIIVDVFAKIR